MVAKGTSTLMKTVEEKHSQVYMIFNSSSLKICLFYAQVCQFICSMTSILCGAGWKQEDDGIDMSSC